MVKKGFGIGTKRYYWTVSYIIHKAILKKNQPAKLASKAHFENIEKKEEAPSRKNQPTGYNDSIPGYAPVKRTACRFHEYDYYPVDWVNQSTFKEYKKGYYDENGDYYPVMIRKTRTNYAGILSCKNCGDQNVFWAHRTTPVCPNCKEEIDFDLSKAQIDYNKISESNGFNKAAKEEEIRKEDLLTADEIDEVYGEFEPFVYQFIDVAFGVLLLIIIGVILFINLA